MIIPIHLIAYHCPNHNSKISDNMAGRDSRDCLVHPSAKQSQVSASLHLSVLHTKQNIHCLQVEEDTEKKGELWPFGFTPFQGMGFNSYQHLARDAPSLQRTLAAAGYSQIQVPLAFPCRNVLGAHAVHNYRQKQVLVKVLC